MTNKTRKAQPATIDIFRKHRITYDTVYYLVFTQQRRGDQPASEENQYWPIRAEGRGQACVILQQDEPTVLV